MQLIRPIPLFSKSFVLPLFLLIVIFLVAGCAVQSDQAEPEVPEIDTGTDTALKQSDVEIVWQVPEESVDGFVLYYGYEEAALDSEVSVSVDQIEQLDDPDYGKLYRYVLEGVVPDKTVYVAIASVQGDTTSERSEVIAIEGE